MLGLPLPPHGRAVDETETLFMEGLEGPETKGLSCGGLGVWEPPQLLSFLFCRVKLSKDKKFLGN